MKLNFKNASFSAAKKIIQLLLNSNYDARFAGGCVRDLLLKRVPIDYDVATTATPEQMLKLFNVEKHTWIKHVVPTGIEHGTISVILKNTTIEVTTLRRDVETDGRHATVVFGNSFEEDAARRDFTVNAMFLDLQNKIYDFFAGQKDIKSKSLRFVGDPEERIEEDYLRVLRFFRFWSQLDFTPDKKSLIACTRYSTALATLSRERINLEWLKLLDGKNFEAPLTYLLKKNIALEIFPELNQFPIPKILNFISNVDPDLRFHAWFCLLQSSEALVYEYKVSTKIYQHVECIARLQKILMMYSGDPISHLELTSDILKKMDETIWMHSLLLLEKLSSAELLRIPSKIVSLFLKIERTVAPIRRKKLPFDGNSLMKKYGITAGPEVKQKLLEETRVFWRKHL